MPLPISVCTTAGLYDPAKAVHFEQIIVKNFDQLTSIILGDRAWTPSLLKNNYRKKENWIGCGWMALDIDDGLPIEDAIKLLHNYMFVLGTTKSHRKEKMKPSGEVMPPCDRYRIVIPARSVCRDLEDFEYSMKVFAKQFEADMSVLEGGRFYFRCSEIHTSQTQGKPFTWMQLTDEEKASIRSAKAARNEKKGLSRRGARILQGADADEGRHKSIFHAAADLGRSGFTLEDTIKIILTTPIAEELIYEKGNRELERNITNGHREGSQ